MYQLPQWFEKLKIPLYDRLAALNPFPFDQPENSDGYISCHHNDYLRLSRHPEVTLAKNTATEETGSGAMASVVYGGYSGFHGDFQKQVALSAEAEGPECIVLTTCGWTANVGLMEAIANPDIPVYLDIYAHASLWDGARFAGSRIIPLRHNDTKALRSFVKTFGPGVVAIDSYYSTNGSVANLGEYATVCEETGCLLVVDEAHSFALTGKNGGGLAVEQGVADRIPLRTVSIAKGLGGHGGFIIADKKTSEYLTYRLRSVIFSSAPTPATSAGNCKALEIVMREPNRARDMHARAALLRKLLNEAQVDTGPSKCQIVSLMFKGSLSVCKLYAELKKRGILFSAFLPPAVPENTSLARFSIYFGITEKEIEYMAEQIIASLTDLGIRSEFPKGLRAI